MITPRKLIHGTAHFLSLSHAAHYYAAQGYAEGFSDALLIVGEKLDAGEISLGVPDVPPGFQLITMDDGDRYGLEEATA